MRSCAALAVLLAVAPAGAQERVRVGGVEVIAVESGCWSNSYAQCDHATHASIRVRAGSRAARVRVVGVELAPAYDPTAWITAASPTFLVPAGSGRRRSALTIGAGQSIELAVMHDPVRVQDAVYRLRLIVDGQPVTLLARYVVWVEHPDPEF